MFFWNNLHHYWYISFYFDWRYADSGIITPKKFYNFGPWAQNAPKFHLPKDVAFRVGGESGIDWLVLQVQDHLIEIIVWA